MKSAILTFQADRESGLFRKATASTTPSVTHLLRNQGKLQNGLQKLGHDIDCDIADIALRVRGYQASQAVADNGYDWTLTRFAENEKEQHHAA